MQETWVRSLGQEDPLEKGMATHSSILAWRIPWTEEPDGLQCIGSQTGGHNWVANHYAPLWGPGQWCLGFPGISLFTPLFNYNRILSVHLSIVLNGVSLVCLFCFLFYLTNHGADSILNLGFAFLTKGLFSVLTSSILISKQWEFLISIFLSFSFFKDFFWCGPFFKFFIEFVTILFLFYVLVFQPKAYGILAPQTGIEPAPLVGRQSLNHWTARKGPLYFYYIIFIIYYFKLKHSWRTILC